MKKSDWLGFIGGYLSFAGSLFLGAIAVWQNHKSNELNEKIREESIYFQKLANQNAFPIVKLENLINETWSYHNKLEINDDTFSISYNLNNKGKKYVIDVLLAETDCEEKFCFKLKFELRNYSNSTIKSIKFDSIFIPIPVDENSQESKWVKILCNKNNSISELLVQNDKVLVEINICHQNKKLNMLYQSIFNEISLVLFLENISISDIKFKESIEITIFDKSKNNIRYNMVEEGKGKGKGKD